MAVWRKTPPRSQQSGASGSSPLGRRQDFLEQLGSLREQLFVLPLHEPDRGPVTADPCGDTSPSHAQPEDILQAGTINASDKDLPSLIQPEFLE